MGKIISFQPYIKSSLVEEKITRIKKELTKETLTERKLHELEKEIIGLTGSLSQEMAREVEVTSQLIVGFITQQTELSNLIFNCHTLSVDKKVDSLTCKAQHLTFEECHEEKLLQKKIGKIKKSIDLLFAKEALSLENRQMIALARQFLSAASEHKMLHSKESSAKDLRLELKVKGQEKDLRGLSEISIDLFTIAGHIYEMDCKEASMLFMSLPEQIQISLQDLLKKQGVSFDLIRNPGFSKEAKEGRYKIMQALMGYSHQLLEGQYESISFEDIDALFVDLRSVLKERVM